MNPHRTALPLFTQRWAPWACLSPLGLLACSQLVGIEDWHPAALTDHEVPSFEPADDAGQEDAQGAWPEASSQQGSGMDADGCTDEAWRCDGVWLQTCGHGAWSTLKTCLTAALCDAQQRVCHAPICSAGQAQCQGSVLNVCNASLTGWDVVACGSVALCNAYEARCEPAACAPAESRCIGATWQTCLADRTGWWSQAVCITPELCDHGLPGCHEPACSPGQRRCDGKKLQVCNAGRTGWDNIKSCPSACDAIQGTCVP